MKPNKLIIHHTAVSYQVQPEQFWIVNEYHRQLWNFKSSLDFYCGYAWFIEKDGKTIQARLDDEEQAHTKGANLDSIGICLSGNFDIEKPTEAQLVGLKSLILQKMTQWAIHPNDIYGHRVYASYKSCPGKLWKESELRELFNPNISYYQSLLNSLKDLLMRMKSESLGSISRVCIDKNSKN